MPEEGNILHWNRLEPRPRKEDFDRVLKAEVRDALWMMTRQWQFGELQGEDAGSAIFSRVHLKKTYVSKYQLGLAPGSLQRPYSQIPHENLPLEAHVEKGKITADHLMRLEMGKHWEIMLEERMRADIANHGGTLPVNTEDLIKVVIDSFRDPLKTPNLTYEKPPDTLGSEVFYSNPDLYLATELASKRRAIDGQKLLDHLEMGAASHYLNAADPLISQATANGFGVAGSVDLCGQSFKEWLQQTYALPEEPDARAWKPSNLEHQALCAIPAPPRAPVSGEGMEFPAYSLLADEYYHGHLDWYSFDFDPQFDLNFGFEEGEYENMTKYEDFTTIPTPIEFSGHPRPRWWEMEDGLVDWSDLHPSTSDTAKMVFSEFAVNYSNDWMIFPYTLPMSILCQMQEIVVTDAFGQRMKIGPTSNSSEPDWNIWSFFGITQRPEGQIADIGLFFPPVTHQVQESKHLEKVSFIRDEMANMVWAIEQVIPDGLGEAMDGYEAGTKVREKLADYNNPEPPDLHPNEAKLSYKIGDEMPENWIPFIPVKLEGDPWSRPIQLRRGSLPRYLEGQTSNLSRIRPRTTLLQENVDDLGKTTEKWNAYHVYEEEVPRSGATVMRTWQRTRTADGRVVVWLGRRKTHGGIEGASSYRFDRLEDK